MPRNTSKAVKTAKAPTRARLPFKKSAARVAPQGKAAMASRASRKRKPKRRSA